MSLEMWTKSVKRKYRRLCYCLTLLTFVIRSLCANNFMTCVVYNLYSMELDVKPELEQEGYGTDTESEEEETKQKLSLDVESDTDSEYGADTKRCSGVKFEQKGSFDIQCIHV